MSINKPIQPAYLSNLSLLSEYVESTNHCDYILQFTEQAASFLNVIGSFPNLYLILLNTSKSELSWYAFNDKIQLLAKLKSDELSLKKHNRLIREIITTQTIVRNLGKRFACCSIPQLKTSTPKPCSAIPLLNSVGDSLGVILTVNSDIETKSVEHFNLFRLFCHNIGAQLYQFTKQGEIDQQITLKTQFLKRDIKEKEESEKLKNVLFTITSFTHQNLNLKQMYIKVHETINTLINSSNIGIIRYREADQMLDYDYVRDPRDEKLINEHSFPFGGGLTSFIIRQKSAQLLTQTTVKKKIAQGLIEGVFGDPDFTSWIGAPMISQGNIYGVIYVQSYDDERLFNAHDLDLLTFVASHVATAIKITLQKEKNAIEQEDILKQHKLLQQNNLKLENALSLLHLTEQKLIEKEKQTSLTSLFAGLANAVAVPLSESSKNTHLIQQLDTGFLNAYRANQLTEKKLLSYVHSIKTTEQLLLENFKTTAAFVDNFKKISVEQSVNSIRKFHFNHFMMDTLQTLIAENKILPNQVICSFEDDVEVYTDIKAIKDIIKQLISNSILHGYKEAEIGKISISIQFSELNVHMTYSDSGSGMSAKNLKRIFDPYFVAKNNSGKGSGLGTNLIYNLVTSVLKGEVNVSSPIGKGLTYIFAFPKELAKKTRMPNKI